MLTRIITAALSCLALAAAAPGVSATAATNVVISGTVVDLSGSPVKGVVVGTGHSASRDTTDAHGHFSFPTETTGDGATTILTFLTDYTQPSYVAMGTQPIIISGDLSLGTVTLPHFPAKTIRVVDSGQTPVYGANLSAGPYTLAAGWDDAGHQLTPSLTVGQASFYINASANAAGEVRALFPVMSNGGLPSIPVYMQSGDSIYTANLSGAVGTNPHVVTISGYTVGPPNAPSSVTASASTAVAGEASVHWGLALPNGSAVTGYTITATPGGATRQVGADQATATFTGLPGVSHTFTVTAHSSAGAVTSSPSNPVVPPSLPSTPPDLRATDTGPGQVTVTWGPSSGNGDQVDGYRFEFAGTPGDTFRSPDQRSVVLNRLAEGGHTMRVWARNRYGESAPATVTFYVPAAPPAIPPPAPAPAMPTGPLATAPSKMDAPKVVVRGRKAVVRWKTAVPNGSAVTRYLVDISKGKDKTTSGNARKTALKRLKPGRYRVRVGARNAIGTSPYSKWVSFRVR